MQGISSILSSSIGGAQNSANRLGEDFDTFLTLLTTQLQAQDPLDPMDSNEFTSQLVEFTSVEQQIAANKNLENVAALLAFNVVTGSVDYLGTEVTLPQAQANFDGDPIHWLYELKATARDVKLEIVNRSGAVVRELPGQIDQGMHGLTWDGTDANGLAVPPGEYRLRVTAENSANEPVPHDVFLRGLVDGVEMEGAEALLTVGGYRIPLTDVVAVGLPDQQQNTGG